MECPHDPPFDLSHRDSRLCAVGMVRGECMSAVEQVYAELGEIVLDVPPPPSVNRTRKVHWAGHRKYEAWKTAAGLHLVENGQFRKAKPGIKGQYELMITLNESMCKLDPDNAAKAVSDFLKSLELITDDNPTYARRIVIQWGEAPSGCRVTLRAVHPVDCVHRESQRSSSKGRWLV